MFSACTKGLSSPLLSPVNAEANTIPANSDDFISPDIFEMYKEEGLKRGLKYVESGPLVRSSYHAERHVNVPI